MPEVPTEGLRHAVCAGRFFGQTAADAGVTAALAMLVASTDARAQLWLWFGAGGLRALARLPDPAAGLRAALDRDIATLDTLISTQLDAVLHHPRLRRLEGSWRGLQWLIDRLPRVGNRVRLKMLQARWSEVCRDLERALEFDQSHLFRKIHEEQFGTAGGEPFGLIAGDYEVRHRPGPSHPTDDVGALSSLAGIAAASFSPMVLGAAPELLGLQSFAELTPSFDPATMLQGAEHQRWRQSSVQEDLRFIGIALPRVLGRAPWLDDGSRADRFRYRPTSPGPAERVWTSPVYGFAAVAIRAFDRYSWPADVRGAAISDEASGGVLDNLPIERFHSDPRGESPARAPLEVALTDEQENRISDAGLIPLSALDGLPEACFGALPSLHRPPRMSSAIAEANQRMSAQLNTLLCVSRFAHCVKIMGRDMTGSYLDPDEVQQRLQKWLSGFIGGAGLGSIESTARYPLLDAQVEVRERRGAPGVYNCTVHLKPHHQLDEVGASFRLVTEFSQRNATA
ncbi:MAG: type VI secretion system contractile sheath large subunit [Chitinophagaceae bacterium]|nr:type VI secretion system contractile sheath large subunit [Rubrivivax sp.]